MIDVTKNKPFLAHRLIVIGVVFLLCFTANFSKANIDSTKFSNEYLKAKQFLVEGKKQKAIKKLKKIISQNSFYHQAPLLVAYIYENDKNYTEAAKYFSIAIKSKPQNALLYFSRGNCYFALKKYNLAVADYNTTIRYDSLFLGAYNNMALARIFNQGNNQNDIREEDFKLARDNIKKFEQKGNINDPKVLQNLGLIHLYLFDFSASKSYFTNIIAIDSSNAIAHFYCGLNNYYLRNYDAALDSFKKANVCGYENKNQLNEFISFTTFVIEQMKLPENKKQ
jgi:tetratricopeptide (TPR) repeat protein